MPPVNMLARSAVALAVSQALMLGATQAATITVDSAADDGVDCTLRDAVTTFSAGSDQANDCLYSGVFGVDDTIDFDGGLGFATIALTQGQLYINPQSNLDLTIDGSGLNNTILSGGGQSRVFYIRDMTLRLNNLTVANGSASVDGGGIRARTSNLYLDDVLVRNNTAGSQGGGIHASNSLVTINDSSINGNYANAGGGLQLRSGSSTLTNSTVSGNSATSEGGGFLTSSNETLTFINSTVSGNLAQKAAGLSLNRITLRLSNSTVSSNVASFNGGAIYATLGMLYMDNSTIANNSAQIRPGLTVSATSVTMTNSIIAGNRANLGTGTEITAFTNEFTATNNLFGDSANTSATAFGTFSPDPSNITATSDGTNPASIIEILGPLSNNRGDTFTHALKPNSLAIDAGDNVTCETEDQRGELRNDGACDIGAVEFIADQDVAIIEVDSRYDDGTGCTLREAVNSVNFQSPADGCTVDGGLGVTDIIRFNPALSGETIELTQAAPLILFNINTQGIYLRVEGSGVDNLEINGQNNAGIFYVRDANLSLNNVTLAGGNSPTFGGGAVRARDSEVYLYNTVLKNNNASNGGALQSYDGKIRLIDSTLTGNSASSSGGAIRTVRSEVEIKNSTVAANSAPSAAGIRLSTSSNLELENSTISGNSAGVLAGGIFADSGSVNINHGTITDNSAMSSGGIYTNSSATISITNSIVSGNRAPVNAAEVRLNGATFNGILNLFGDDAYANASAFSGINLIYNPQLTATSDGGVPTPLAKIIGPLADNRGATQTHALRLNSLALGRGGLSDCTATDQRGESRDATCDLGAVEFNASLDAASIEVDTGSDDGVGCTLRKAIDTFNSRAPVSNDCVIDGTPGIADTIEFAPALSNSTITLTQPSALLIDEPGIDLTINGLGQEGLKIDGNNNGGVFAVTDNAVTFNDLTIANGSESSKGGGIQAYRASVTLSNTTVTTSSAEFGGGISATNSNLILDDSLIIDNAASQSGGGVAIDAFSIVSITDSELSGNSAAVLGGAIQNLNGEVTIKRSLLNANSAILGAAISGEQEATSVIANSTFSANSASVAGGGIFAFSSDFDLTSSTFSMNSAITRGGAIALNSDMSGMISVSTLSMTNSTLSANSTAGSGGAVYSNYSVIRLTNNTLSGNSASTGGALNTSYDGVYLNNNLISGNFAPTAAEVHGDVSSTMSGGFNLIGDNAKTNAQAYAGFTLQVTDITATSDGSVPTLLSDILGPLTNNNGGTLTHAISAISPAESAADAANCPAFDQIGQRRGTTRCDIGAFEFDSDGGFIVIPLGAGRAVVIPN